MVEGLTSALASEDRLAVQRATDRLIRGLTDAVAVPPVKVDKKRETVRWLSFGDDFRAFLREYRPDGEWTWAQWLWSLCSRKIYDVFSWRDPWPAVVCATRYLRLNWSKVRRYLQRTGARASMPVPLQPAAPLAHHSFSSFASRGSSVRSSVCGVSGPTWR
jgi:hypothetical protein